MKFESRICKLHKELLPYLIPGIGNPNSNLMNVELYSWDSHTFNLHYVVRNMYNNMSILYEAILDSTDKFLDWVDLTEFGDNFKIHLHIVEGNKVFSFTYFELMDAIEGRNFNGYYDPYSYTDFRVGTLSNHKKYRDYMVWKSDRKIEREIQRKKNAVNALKLKRMLEGGEPMYHLNDELITVETPVKKTFIGKIKEKLLSLHNND